MDNFINGIDTIVGTQQCRVPTISPDRDTALPCPLYHSGAAGMNIIPVLIFLPFFERDRNSLPQP